ncbi:uncharacterized protein LOC135196530 [Macrobrachium nipponense]|uniref:uncharacterized protein LOC135196530 n=1 Tax=Macrobrachium nipponense TaxID=159736 RepID=UPI0030C7CA0C
MAENSDTENDSTVILDSSQDSSSVEIIEGAKKLAEISEVEKDSTVILESSLDSSGVEIIEDAKSSGVIIIVSSSESSDDSDVSFWTIDAAYSSKGLEDSFSGADVDAIVVSSDSSGISIVKSDLHGIARNKDVVAVLNSSKKYTGNVHIRILFSTSPVADVASSAAEIANLKSALKRMELEMQALKGFAAKASKRDYLSCVMIHTLSVLSVGGKVAVRTCTECQDLDDQVWKTHKAHLDKMEKDRKRKAAIRAGSKHSVE